MNVMRYIVLTVAVLLGAAFAEAKDLSLPCIFSDHMVLQAEAAVPVWGWAPSGSRVQVSIAGQSADAVVDSNGRWEVALAPVKKGGPYVMRVSDGLENLTVKDVLFGEVWLASGQSNMGVNVGKSNGAEAGLQLADQLPVRFFTMPISLNLELQDDLAGGRWIVCTSENSATLSAVGYYFACEVSRTLNSPVAVIQSAWGGSRIQNWMPFDAVNSNPDLRHYATEFEQKCKGLSEEQKTPEGLMELGNMYLQYNNAWVKYQKTKTGPEPVPPTTPRPRRAVALNYNAMIYPLAPYAIKGALWYQGEANTNGEDASLYAEMLSTMIRSWRSLWNRDFPFIFAQLPEYEAKGREENWVCLRDQQRRVLGQSNGTAMVVTLGHGNMKDIHPLDKRPVGEMMAGAALSKVYQRETPWCGPLIQSVVQEGSQLVLSFETFGRNLKGTSSELEGFEISTDGKTFQPAPAVIKNNQVVIPASESVLAVRYGWDVNPKLALTDELGFPASPFLEKVQ